MKMPPEPIDMFTQLLINHPVNHLKIHSVPIDEIMNNTTVAPSAESPRITSSIPVHIESNTSVVGALIDTDKYEDPWTCEAIVPAEATKSKMLYIFRQHRRRPYS